MKIEAGDTIHHGPTGEDWLLLGVNEKRDEVCAAGWPATVAKLSDCTLKAKGKGISEEELAHRNRAFGSCWDD